MLRDTDDAQLSPVTTWNIVKREALKLCVRCVCVHACAFVCMRASEWVHNTHTRTHTHTQAHTHTNTRTSKRQRQEEEEEGEEEEGEKQDEKQDEKYERARTCSVRRHWFHRRKCVVLYNVFSYCRMCSLTVEYVLLLQRKHWIHRRKCVVQCVLLL